MTGSQIAREMRRPLRLARDTGTPPKAACGRCEHEREASVSDESTRAPQGRAATGRGGHCTHRHTGLAATGDTGWQFERHARFPARPPTVTTTAKSVVCCEREAFEVEGAGHDEWCPTVTASNHDRGDAA